MKKRKGVALLTAVLILVLFGTLGFVAANLFLTDARIAQDTLRSSQGLFIAEAGINYLLENLSKDDDWTDNVAPGPKNISGGNFSINFVSQQKRELVAEVSGSMEDVRRKIRVWILSLNPLGYGLYVGGQIHDQQAEYFEEPPETLEGATVFPVIDYAFYKSYAQANYPTQVISGNHNFSSGTYSGLWYIEGNVSFAANVIINGSIVATGNVDMSKNDHITIDSYPAPYTGARAKYGISYWSQSGLGSYDGNKANDGVIVTNCFSTASSPAGAYLQLDLGSGNSREFVDFEFLFDTALDFDNWTLKYSDNGTSWTNISASGARVPSGSSDSGRYRYSWNSVGSHRYWRVEKNATGSGGTYTEVQFVAELPDALGGLLPALVAKQNFLFQDATDLTIIGLIYCGTDLSGNLLTQKTQYVNFIGNVIVAGNLNLQQSEYISVIYQDLGILYGILGIGTQTWQEIE